MSFLFSVSVVGSVFAMLLATGIAVMYKRFGAKPLAFALLSSIIPLVGVAAYSFAPRASFNVRYTLVAFPYFCLLTGTALAWLARTHRLLGTVAVLAVLVASATSLYNYFTNSRYAKEDVRAAVTFWRYAGKNEPLLSYKAKYTTDRYLDPSERPRHFMIGGKTVESIDRVLSYLTPSSAYILIARDWNGAIEKVVRNAFPVAQERAFPGVKILRISGCRAGELSDPLRGCGTRERPSSLISHSPGVKFFR